MEDWVKILADGKLRWWQLFNLFQVGLVGFFLPMQHLSMPLYAPSLDHWCSPPSSLRDVQTSLWLNFSIPLENSSSSDVKHSQCKQYDVDYQNVTSSDYVSYALQLHSDNGTKLLERKCDDWSYSTSWKRTIVSDWNLVCNRSVLVSTASSIYMAGMGFGVFVMPQIADRYGRRLVNLGSLITWLVSGIGAAFSPNIIVFCIIRFVTAASAISSITTSYVLCQESLTGWQRATWGNYTNATFPIAILINTGTMYYLRDWKIDQIIWSVPVIILIFVQLIGPESPRWLLSVGRHQDALKTIRYIASKNKVELPDISNLEQLTDKEQSHKEEEDKENTNTILDLFKSPRIRIFTIVCYLQWFTTSFCYFAFTLNTSNLGGNLFINLAISSVLEVVGVFVSTLFMLKVGRRMSSVYCLVGAGVLMLLSLPVPNNLMWLKIGLTLIGRSLISMVFVIIYVHTSELMPTVLRSVGLGSSSACARIGGIIAPYCNEIGKLTNQSVPLIIYGILCVVTGLATILLPETLNQTMPDTIAEVEERARLVDACGVGPRAITILPIFNVLIWRTRVILQKKGKRSGICDNRNI